MLGVFKRRWKPKRVPSDSIRPPIPEDTDRPLRAPPTRQIHPLSAEPNQLLAYDATVRRKAKALEASEGANHPKKCPPPSPVYPMAQTICVEGGRIEFVKSPLECATGISSTPSSPYSTSGEEKFDGDKEALEARIRQLERRLEAEASNAQRDRMAVAKLQQQLAKQREEGVSRDADVARSEVHARLARAEQEAERANARLRAAHRELARMEETVRSLLQYKNRVETLKQEKTSLSATLEARSIQYRTTLSRLSAEKASLETQLKNLQDEAAARCRDDAAARLMAALLDQKTLREELTRLDSRARDLEAQNRALGALLLRQLRPKPTPSPASPLSPPQCNGNVSPNSKSSTLVESPTFNSLRTDRQMSSLKSHSRRSRLSKSSNDIPCCLAVSQSDSDEPKPKRLSVGNVIPPKSIISFNGDIMSVCVSHQSHKLSSEDKRRHQILTDLWTELRGIEVTPQSLLQALRAVDPALWVPPERPLTLNLKRSGPNMLSQYLQRLSQTLPDHLDQLPIEDEIVVESPESGNRDEGYSTMSSDVQADPSRQSEPNRELEDLKEASDETDNQILLSNTIIIEDKTESDIMYIPFNLALSFNQRNSYPPSKNILPFQHIMRSFSDSHLCLRLTATTSPCGESCFSITSPISSSPSILHIDVAPMIPKEKKKNLRRAKGTTNLISSSAGYDSETPRDRNSWASNIDEQVEGCQYDAEYVQHWLQLDDTRSALQQQHRDLLELEYDRAELEDWSLNLSYEDLREGNWKRNSLNDANTPGQNSLSTLPSIQENNALELEEDVSECLWNNSSYMVDSASDKFQPLSIDAENKVNGRWPYTCMDSSDLPSPGGSWSSIDNSEDCCLNNDCYYDNANADNENSKRSSAAMSGFSDEPESSVIGTDFTRDFYRLVKFESTKSLASNSSRGVPIGESQSRSEAPQKQDREQVLQNVLNFIAEQQMYCHNREELDSLPSRPTSEIHELPPPYVCENNFKNLSETNYSTVKDNESCDIILSENYSRYNDMPNKCLNLSGRSETSAVENYFYTNNVEMVHKKNELNKNEAIAIKNAVEEPTPLADVAKEESTSTQDVPSEVETPGLVRKWKNEPLLLVPEEEESTDNSIMQTSDSMTTSISTSDTIATEIQTNKRKSKIPLPVSSTPKRHSQIPVKNKAKATPNKAECSTSSNNIIVSQGPSHSKIVSFHESATSKDVIDELNRMIRKGDEVANESEVSCMLTSLDNALWRPSGWVHVERDIDFSDPKARANLLDVMLASSDSSPSPTSSCTGSFSSESSEDKADYSKLHRLHRYRRQKKAAALRERGLAVLRFSCLHRPSIIGRDNIFVRYGKQEKDAVACFDFLEDILPANGADKNESKDGSRQLQKITALYQFANSEAKNILKSSFVQK